MRRFLFVLFAACTRANAPIAAHVDPLPAGLCGFDNYLECDHHPSFAVLVTNRPANLAFGYPFAVSTDDIPIAGKPLGTIVMIAGLFDDEHAARVLARDVGGSVERIKPEAPEIHGEDYVTAVEMLHAAPAYSQVDLERVWNENDEKPWVPLPDNFERVAKDVEKLHPVCTVEKGSVHAAKGGTLYRFMRRFAPVKCADGRDAWVSWRATRLESTVKPSDILVQVILVECDVPTREIRSFSQPAPARPQRLDDGRCD